MLVDARDVYSQHKFDVGKSRQKFHVTGKRNVETKRQGHSKVLLHLKEKLEKLLTQLEDADIIREMGDNDEVLEVDTLHMSRSSNAVKQPTEIELGPWPFFSFLQLFVITFLLCIFKKTRFSDKLRVFFDK